MSFITPNLFDAPDDFTPSVPKLHMVLDIEPKAHRETKFTKKGFAVTDEEKRDYMIRLAGMMRPWEGWFKGVRCVKLKIVFVFERPDKAIPDGQRRVEWEDPNLELYKCNAPDLDNLEKSLQDCLSYHVISKGNGLKPTIMGAGVIDNDCRIVNKSSHKIYAKKYKGPKIEITLTEISIRFQRKKRSSNNSNHKKKP